jgi:DNA-binding transcriptional LysR family regulator
MRCARAWADTFDLRVLEPPLELAPYAVLQLWHPRHEADAGHRWLRQQVMEAARATRPRKRK